MGLLILCNRLDKSWDSRLSRTMNAMLIVNTVMLVCCIVSRYLEGKAEYEALDCLFTCGRCGLAYLLVPFYTKYIQYSIGSRKSSLTRLVRIVIALSAFALALNVVSIFNHMYFSCEGGVYARGPLFLLNQVPAAAVLTLDSVMIVQNRKLLGKPAYIFLLSYALLPLAALPAQFPVPELDAMEIATTLSLLIVFMTVHIQRSRQFAEREKQLTESRMEVVRSQLQPHFLFNALTAIQEMCHVKSPETEEAVVEFAEYLRGNLDSLRRSEPIAFSQELYHTKNYLALEKKRFSGHVRAEYDIRAVDFTLPALTLQPVVENAVRMGVTQREGGGTVRISSVEDADVYRVTVSDDGVGFDATKIGGNTGIANIRERLKNLCGGALDVQSVPGVGTTAVITIPKKEGKRS